MMKIKTRCRHPQIEIYERILLGEPFNDILDKVLNNQKKEIMEKLERYRTIESREMTVSHRAKQTGLKKGTCEDLNRVYSRIVRCGAT